MKRFIYKTIIMVDGKPVEFLYGHAGNCLTRIYRWSDEIDGFYEAAKYGYKTRRGAENNKLYKENKDRFGIEIIEVEA